jgi:hypothetical protein
MEGLLSCSNKDFAVQSCAMTRVYVTYYMTHISLIVCYVIEKSLLERI